MRTLFLIASLLLPLPAAAQTPPSPSELRVYAGLHAAAAKGDATEIARLIAAKENINAQDPHSRTPLIVAAHFRHVAAAEALMKAGANANALDAQKYDIVTIAAVNDDVPMLKAALAGGCNPKNITSPYNGTALIAAAHLGHEEVVRALIAAGAPLDHVNNLGWTALMESIVLGNGGKRHIDTLEALVKAGANPNIADRQGVTPLGHAKQRGYAAMVRILEAAGAR
ncbi:MAG TPA: ankyrin repeat domain-containing protein [Xanthobacteraceae bacterium]|nr:ankyrin repeat domain-containing protein [Xanthobacteraceae bacterium]